MALAKWLFENNKCILMQIYNKIVRIYNIKDSTMKVYLKVHNVSKAKKFLIIVIDLVKAVWKRHHPSTKFLSHIQNMNKQTKQEQKNENPDKHE